MQKIDWGKKIGHSTLANSTYTLNELSISAIKQKLTFESSVDFAQEKDLINQMEKNVNQLGNQYGLGHEFEKEKIEKGKKQNGGNCLILRESCSGRLRKSLSKQHNMCFNKQIKRKKTTSKSKQKQQILVSSLNTSRSLEKLRLSSKNLLSSRKPILNQNIKDYIPNQIKIKPFPKAIKIDLKLRQDHLPRDSSAWEINQKFRRIYYNMPDDFKLEINDLNHNVNIEFRTDKERKDFKEKPFVLGLRHDLKKSYLSRPQFSISLEKKPKSRNSDIIGNQTEQRVIELSKSLNKNGKNLSFYSTSTQQQESPYSKDKTSRVIRRSQIYSSQQGDDQQYYAKQINRSNFYR